MIHTFFKIGIIHGMYISGASFTTGQILFVDIFIKNFKNIF